MQKEIYWNDRAKVEHLAFGPGRYETGPESYRLESHFPLETAMLNNGRFDRIVKFVPITSEKMCSEVSLECVCVCHAYQGRFKPFDRAYRGSFKALDHACRGGFKPLDHAYRCSFKPLTRIKLALKSVAVGVTRIELALYSAAEEVSICSLLNAENILEVVIGLEVGKKFRDLMVFLG